MSGLKDAGSPLDFVKTNLKQQPTSPILDPQKMANDLALQKAEEDRVKAELDAKTGQNKAATAEPEFPVDPKTEDKKIEVKDNTPILETEGEVDDLDVPNIPAAENFKRIRTKLRETTKNLKEIETAKTKAESELADFKTGKVLPEVLVEKQAEIDRLSYFEKIHNLKGSKEYKQKFIEPAKQINEQLKAIATDYGLPEDVLDTASKIQSRKELNEFLSDHFDDVGAAEVKLLINKAQQIEANAKEAEKEPIKALASLQEEHKIINEAQAGERKARIANSARDAWVSSLTDIRKEGKIHELIMRENDPDHNEKIAKPVITAASHEYGKFVKMFADLGIENLPTELANALAKSCLLSHASAIAIHTRDSAIKYATEIEQNTSRLSQYSRPSIGGGVGGSTNAPQQQPRAKSTEEAAEAHINSILQRQR